MASRVIPNIPPDGITEFPYFSFLLGDLHPHFQTLPLDLAILSLGLALALVGWRSFGRAGLVVSALVLGSLIAANTWDVPTFWLAFAAASVYATNRHPESAVGRWTWARKTALPFLLAIALYMPYFVSYVSQPLGLGLVRERTHPGSLLVVLGPFLVLALIYGAWSLVEGRTRAALEAAKVRFGTRGVALLGAVALVTLLLEVALGEWTLVILTVPLALVAPIGAAYLEASPGSTATGDNGSAAGPASAAHLGGLAVWFLTTFGLLVLLGTELIYIHDSFGTRMNTVFKFQYHTWLLLGLATALILALLFHEARARGVARPVAVGLAAVVVALGGVYPVTATLVKSNQFRGQPTLDGSRFLAQSRVGDFRAIEWLRGQSAHRPVVLEAVGGDYQEFGRVSTFSGLPTVMGWVGHELQWRGHSPELNNRSRDVELIYRDGDEATIRRLLDRYRVRYVFVGSLETERYGSSVDGRFSRFLETAFQTQGAVVYQVPAAVAQAGRDG
jgi:YYY domain-containing protein